MTSQETLQILKKGGKSIGLTRFYHFLNELSIKPVGARQRPQHYPPDTANRILAHLGLAGGSAIVGASAVVAGKRRQAPSGSKLLSIHQIKARTGRKTKAEK